MGCSASRPNTHFTTKPPNTENPSPSPHSNSQYSSSKKTISRTLSLPSPLVHHPPLRKGDTNHLVSLTSTTYGSLVLISTNFKSPHDSDHDDDDGFSSPDSVINTWELMDGLDDDDFGADFDVDSSIRNRPVDGSVSKLLDSYEIVEHEEGLCRRSAVSKPLWKHLSEESMLSKMDPNVVSSYRRALSSSTRHFGQNGSIRSMESSPLRFSQPKKIIESFELKTIGSLLSSPMNFQRPKTIGSLMSSPVNVSQSKTPERDELLESSSPMNLSDSKIIGSSESASPSSFSQSETNWLTGSKTPERDELLESSAAMNFSDSKNIGLLESDSPMIFSQPEKNRLLGSFSPKNNVQSNDGLYLPGTEDRVVMYITSLRGIRKTYEDCCSVRMIFRGFRVSVDDRDISMDSGYRKELESVLGGKKAVSLPQVFIRGKYVGGAEEVKQLHEVGELGKLLEGFLDCDIGFVCKSCGDARFMPCQNCSGSRKVFEEEEGRLKRCSDCNENGLIRCPICCS